MKADVDNIRMKIESITDAKSVSDVSSVILKIDLNIDNLNRFPMEILYYKEQGFRNFMLHYSFANLNLPMSKVVEKIKDNIIKIVKNYGINLYVSGIQRCLFERDILHPSLRRDFEDKIFFYETANGEEMEHEKKYSCGFCMFNDVCTGISCKYLEKYQGSEFLPLISNKDMQEEYEEEIGRFSDTRLKEVADEIFTDFLADEYFKRKRFVFVRSFPMTSDESYTQRFVYYIYNREDDFEQNFALMRRYFTHSLIEDLESYLRQTNQMVMSFAIMGDGTFRKSMYFSVEDLSVDEIGKLNEVLSLEIEDDYSGVGLDFVDDELNGIKTYTRYFSMKNSEVKQFFSEYDIESKKCLFNFLNSCTKPINEILLDKKIKAGKFFSKRIDISMQYNSFKLYQLSNMFRINIDFLKDKDPYTLSFEVREGRPEKINFYYALRKEIIEPEEDLEETVRFQ